MIKDLDIILSGGESYKVEFKESADKSLPCEVCAFANASGGKIYIGINDNGRIVGADTSSAARSRLQDTLSQVEPPLKVDIDVEDNIVIVTVPEGSRKPYSCPKGFYLRSGPNSQKLKRDSIMEFFQNEGRIHYDEIVHDDLPISERFNETAYRRYIKLARISDVLDTGAMLVNLNCAVFVNSRLCFTNAGILFFRANDEDMKFRHMQIVCALYKGVDKAYILDSKELNSDIVSNIDDAMVFLKNHLRIEYKIEGLQRKNVLELPENALREAVVNAVCHRDYFEKGARVMVEIYDDRVDIVSPGNVCKGITGENFGTVSIARNSVIAGLLYRIGYIEQMGTGIARMKNAAKDASVAEPIFEMSDFFKVSFKRNPSKQAIGTKKQAIEPQKQAIEPQKQAIEPQKQAIKRKKTDIKREIIIRLEQNARATVLEFTDMFSISKSRVRAILQEMISEGTIEKVGKNRYAFYMLKE